MNVSRGLMRPAAALLLTALLAGCVTTMDTAATDAPSGVCLVWQPIRWSTRDTDETIAQAKASNAARLAFGCPA